MWLQTQRRETLYLILQVLKIASRWLEIECEELRSECMFSVIFIFMTVTRRDIFLADSALMMFHKLVSPVTSERPSFPVDQRSNSSSATREDLTPAPLGPVFLSGPLGIILTRFCRREKTFEERDRKWSVRRMSSRGLIVPGKGPISQLFTHVVTRLQLSCFNQLYYSFQPGQRQRGPHSFCSYLFKIKALDL